MSDDMVHLARSPQKSREATVGPSPTTKPMEPDYGYGLGLSLDDEAMGKLGMDGDDAPKVGSTVKATVHLHVDSHEKSPSGSGGHSMRATVTHMKIHGPAVPRVTGAAVRAPSPKKAKVVAPKGPSIQVSAHVRRVPAPKTGSPKPPRAPHIPIVKPPHVKRA